MRRISVVGNSGSGKTTLARALAAELGVPHLELDSVFHQPGWQRQVIWRTLRRVATKAELWNGNREQWRNLLGRPEESLGAAERVDRADLGTGEIEAE